MVGGILILLLIAFTFAHGIWYIIINEGGVR